MRTTGESAARRAAWIGAAAVALLVGTAPQAFAATWVDEPLPPRDTFAELTAAADGDGTTWAFGGSNGAIPAQNSLAYLRDQQGWREVPVPQVGRIEDAAVVAADDVWAVGVHPKYGFGASVHWDGHTWTEVPYAPVADRIGTRSVAAFGPRDVWIAGHAFDDSAGTGRGVVQRWDGAAWQDVPVPQRDGNWAFSDIGGTAPDDLWAVGNGSGFRGQGLAMHWDGTAWTEVPVPEVPLDEYESVALTQVQALAADDVWATGDINDASGGALVAESLLLHWDGTAWSRVESPQDTGGRGDLVRTGGELWSLGERLLHWDGARWTEELGPPTGVPAAGAELADGRLLTAGGFGRYPGMHKPFISIRQG
ncbi:hypothetical protein ABZ805_06920 [Saccharopolyspora sp. NPDC047091]|uniref:hypothetical protein n=1 Tax=Saccharopolyspora sp. NPDC047091 TaxID=3155924 RepID=UPI0033EDAC81